MTWWKAIQNFFHRILRFFGGLLVKYLSTESSHPSTSTHSFDKLLESIQPFDVLLVEGKQRYSVAIKYLTQSNWSHAAIYMGDGILIEADLKTGVSKVPLEKYASFHTRICRPQNLRASDQQSLEAFLKSQLGLQYDLKNVFDLARYLFPTPPVSPSMRRKILHFGSGDPTKAICSSMIAKAFQNIRYPILPVLNNEVYYPRHHTLFTPSDFDRSPYFQIVKPTIVSRFDYKTLRWGHADDGVEPTHSSWIKSQSQ